MKDKNIIFFDGVCELCDRFIQFVFKRDINKEFLYSPLQGQTARQLLNSQDIQNLKSIVFFKQGVVLKESQAVKAIVKKLYPKMALFLRVTPTFIFNWFYRLISKKRYHLFGKKTQMYKANKKQDPYFLP